jgi:hypothetical protein
MLYGNLEASMNVNALNSALLAKIVSILLLSRVRSRATIAQICVTSSITIDKERMKYNIGDLVVATYHNRVGSSQQLLAVIIDYEAEQDETGTVTRPSYRIVFVQGLVSPPMWYSEYEIRVAAG